MNIINSIEKNFQRIMRVSGQDYFIKTNAHINNFFESSSCTVFMNHFFIPDYKRWGSGGGLYRINKYFFGVSFLKVVTTKTIIFFLFLKMLRRSLQQEIQQFYESQWWIIDRSSLKYILDYIKDNSGYCSFHRFTFAPDDLFFHTVFINKEPEDTTEETINNKMRFIKWPEQSTAHPDILIKDNFSEIGNPQRYVQKSLMLILI